MSTARQKKVPTRPSGFLTPIRTDRPFQKVGIDLLGPFPKSTMGNKHIIVAIDYFSKWVIAQAVPSADSIHVVDFFVRRIVLQHGAPLAIISDRGKCLTSAFSEDLFKALQTNHLVTTAYHPQCNGLVERFNHTFADMLSMYVRSRHDNWDDAIDFVVFAYNTSRQETTGFTPFLILYGREPYSPIDVALGNDPDYARETKSPRPYIKDLVTRLPIIREMVRRRVKIAQARQ